MYDNRSRARARKLPDGAGIVIASVLSLAGVALGLVLWLAGHGVWLAVLAWLLLPNLLLVSWMVVESLMERAGRRTRKLALKESCSNV